MESPQNRFVPIVTNSRSEESWQTEGRKGGGSGWKRMNQLVSVATTERVNVDRPPVSSATDRLRRKRPRPGSNEPIRAPDFSAGSSSAAAGSVPWPETDGVSEDRCLARPVVRRNDPWRPPVTSGDLWVGTDGDCWCPNRHLFDSV